MEPSRYRRHVIEGLRHRRRIVSGFSDYAGGQKEMPGPSVRRDADKSDRSHRTVAPTRPPVNGEAQVNRPRLPAYRPWIHARHAHHGCPYVLVPNLNPSGDIVLEGYHLSPDADITERRFSHMDCAFHSTIAPCGVGRETQRGYGPAPMVSRCLKETFLVAAVRSALAPAERLVCARYLPRWSVRRSCHRYGAPIPNPLPVEVTRRNIFRSNRPAANAKKRFSLQFRAGLFSVFSGVDDVPRGRSSLLDHDACVIRALH